MTHGSDQTGADAGNPSRPGDQYGPGPGGEGIPTADRGIQPHSGSVEESGPIPGHVHATGQWQPPLPGYEVTTYRNAPLPEPHELAQFGAIDPSFPERIVAMAERESEAQISTATSIAHAEAGAIRAMANTTMIVSVGGLGSAVVFGLLGIESGVIGGIVIAALSGIAKITGAARSRRE